MRLAYLVAAAIFFGIALSTLGFGTRGMYAGLWFALAFDALRERKHAADD